MRDYFCQNDQCHYHKEVSEEILRQGCMRVPLLAKSADYFIPLYSSLPPHLLSAKLSTIIIRLHVYYAPDGSMLRLCDACHNAIKLVDDCTNWEEK